MLYEEWEIEILRSGNSWKLFSVFISIHLLLSLCASDPDSFRLYDDVRN